MWMLGRGELFEMTTRVGMAAAWTNLAPWSPVMSVEGGGERSCGGVDKF